MQQVAATLRRLSDDEAGQSLVEYGLLFVLVIIGLFALVSLISGPVAAFLQQAIAGLEAITPG